MLSQLVQPLGVGDNAMPVRHSFINKTGATISRGQVVMQDVAGSVSGSSTTDPTSETYSLQYVVTPVQTGVDAGFPLFVADAEIPNNQSGPFVVQGRTEVLVLHDGASVTDVDVGDRLQLLVSESTYAVSAWASNSNGCRTIGLALENAAASGSETDRRFDASSHYRWVIWTAGQFCSGVSDT